MFKKTISAIVLFFFAVNSLFGAVPFSAPMPERFESFIARNASLQIPEDLGSVIHRADGEGPLVIHIQDAHANYEAQSRIKSILKDLVEKQGVSLVGLEGAENLLKPELYRFFPVPEADSAMLDFLVKEGELTGAESFAIENRDSKAEWIGLEDKELYRHDLAIFQKTLGGWDSYKPFFDKAKAGLTGLKARIFSPELRKFDSKQSAFIDGKASLFHYGRTLERAASRFLGLNLSDPEQQTEYPNLVRLSMLSEMETRIKKETSRAMNEKDNLLQALKAGAPAKDKDFVVEMLENMKELTWSSPVPVRYFYELLYGICRKDGIDLNTFPRFKEFAKYLILQNEIDAKTFFAEISVVEGKIADKLIRSEKEKELAVLIRDLRLLEKFLRLEVSREEHAGFKARGAEVLPSSIAERLKALGAGENAFEEDFALLDQALREAEGFYAIAMKREDAFIDKLLLKAREKKVKTAVLISGGFHTLGIQKRLEERNVAHMIVSPKIREMDQAKNYERAILNGKTSLETLLENGNPNRVREARADKISPALKAVDQAVYAELNPNDPTRQEKVALGALIHAVAPLANHLMAQNPLLRESPDAFVEALNTYFEGLKSHPLIHDDGIRLVRAYGETGNNAVALFPSALLRREAEYPLAVIQPLDENSLPLGNASAISATDQLQRLGFGQVPAAQQEALLAAALGQETPEAASIGAEVMPEAMLELSDNAEELIEKYMKENLSEKDIELIRNMVRDYDYRSRGEEAPSARVWFLWGVVWAKMAIQRANESGDPGRKALLARDTRKVEKELIEALAAGLAYGGLDVVYVAQDMPNTATSYSWAVTEIKPLASIFITSSHVADAKLQIRGSKTSMKNRDRKLSSMTTAEIKEESLDRVMEMIENPSALEAARGLWQGKIQFVNVDENSARMNALVGRVAAIGTDEISIYKLARAFESGADAVSVLDEWEQKVAAAENSQPQPFKGIQITIEGANTPSGYQTQRAFQALGAKTVLINGKIKALDKIHRADPSKMENLEELKAEMIANGSQIGLAFDLDGDRGAIVIRKKNGEFMVLPPDILMTAMIPFLIKDCGYNPKTIGKVAVIHDVLSTEAVQDAAKKIEEEVKADSTVETIVDPEEVTVQTRQTDAGYVFLKKEAALLRKDGFTVPMMSERSGHAWLDVTGEYENPVAVAVLFVEMARKYGKQFPQSDNIFEEVFEHNSIPYEQSTRFQPPFQDVYLETLAEEHREEARWEYAYDKTPNQKIIEAGREEAIRKALEEFQVGKKYPTPAGFLTVKSVTVDRDFEETGLYRFIDIRFVDDRGKRAGRFVFRASANDPTFVCSYETKVREDEGEHKGDPSVHQRFISAGGVVFDFMERAGFGHIAHHKVLDLNTREQAASLREYHDYMYRGILPFLAGELGLEAMEEDLILEKGEETSAVHRYIQPGLWREEELEMHYAGLPENKRFETILATQSECAQFGVYLRKNDEPFNPDSLPTAFRIELPETDFYFEIHPERETAIPDIFEDFREQLKFVTVLNALTASEAKRAEFANFLGEENAAKYFDALLAVREIYKANEGRGENDKLVLKDDPEKNIRLLMQRLNIGEEEIRSLKAAVDLFIARNDLFVELTAENVRNGTWTYDAGMKLLFLEQIRVGLVDEQIVRSIRDNSVYFAHEGYPVGVQYNPQRQNRGSTGDKRPDEDFLSLSFIKRALPLQRWLPFGRTDISREDRSVEYVALANPFPHLRNSMNLVSVRQKGETGELPQAIYVGNGHDAAAFLSGAAPTEGDIRFRLFTNAHFAGQTFDHFHDQGFYKRTSLEQAVRKHRGALEPLATVVSPDKKQAEYFAVKEGVYLSSGVLVIEGEDQGTVANALARLLAEAEKKHEVKPLTADSLFTYHVLYTYDEKTKRYRYYVLTRNITLNPFKNPALYLERDVIVYSNRSGDAVTVARHRREINEKIKEAERIFRQARETEWTSETERVLGFLGKEYEDLVRKGIQEGTIWYAGRPATIELIDNTLIYDAYYKEAAFQAVSADPEKVIYVLREIHKEIAYQDYEAVKEAVRGYHTPETGASLGAAKKKEILGLVEAIRAAMRDPGFKLDRASQTTAGVLYSVESFVAPEGKESFSAALTALENLNPFLAADANRDDVLGNFSVIRPDVEKLVELVSAAASLGKKEEAKAKKGKEKTFELEGGGKIVVHKGQISVEGFSGKVDAVATWDRAEIIVKGKKEKTAEKFIFRLSKKGNFKLAERGEVSAEDLPADVPGTVRVLNVATNRILIGPGLIQTRILKKVKGGDAIVIPISRRLPDASSSGAAEVGRADAQSLGAALKKLRIAFSPEENRYWASAVDDDTLREYSWTSGTLREGDIIGKLLDEDRIEITNGQFATPGVYVVKDDTLIPFDGREFAAASLGAADSGLILPPNVRREFKDAEHLTPNPGYGKTYHFNGKAYSPTGLLVPKAKGLEYINEEKLLALVLDPRPGFIKIIVEDDDAMTYATMYLIYRLMELAQREFTFGLATGGTTEALRKGLGLLSLTKEVFGQYSEWGKARGMHTLDDYTWRDPEILAKLGKDDFWWPMAHVWDRDKFDPEAYDLKYQLGAYRNEQKYMLLRNAFPHWTEEELDRRFVSPPVLFGSYGEANARFIRNMSRFCAEEETNLWTLSGLGTGRHDGFTESQLRMIELMSEIMTDLRQMLNIPGTLTRLEYPASILQPDGLQRHSETTQVQNFGHFGGEMKFHKGFLRLMGKLGVNFVSDLLNFAMMHRFEDIQGYLEPGYRFESEEEYIREFQKLLDHFSAERDPSGIGTPPWSMTQKTGNVIERAMNPDTVKIVMVGDQVHKLESARDSFPGEPNPPFTPSALYLAPRTVLIATELGASRMSQWEAWRFTPENANRKLVTGENIEATWGQTDQGRKTGEVKKAWVEKLKDSASLGQEEILSLIDKIQATAGAEGFRRDSMSNLAEGILYSVRVSVEDGDFASAGRTLTILEAQMATPVDETSIQGFELIREDVSQVIRLVKAEAEDAGGLWSEKTVAEDKARAIALLAEHERRFGKKAAVVAKAPGRANIIGEHVDYPNPFPADGSAHNYSVPFALSFNVLVAGSVVQADAAAHDRDRVRLHSMEYGNDFTFMISELEALAGKYAQDETAAKEYRRKMKEQNKMWALYFMGMFLAAKRRGLDIRGGEFTVQGNVPLSGGVSSSAALCVSGTMALDNLFGWGVSADQTALTLLAREGEVNPLVGSECGTMDQTASIRGKKGAAVLVDHGDLNHPQDVEINLGDYEIVLVNTNVDRNLAETDYNKRVKELGEALPVMNRLSGYAGADEKKHVSAFTLEEFRKIEPAFTAENGILAKRVRHVLNERQRVLNFIEKMNDPRIKQLLAEQRFDEAHQLIEAGLELIDEAGDSLSMNGDFEISGTAVLPQRQYPLPSHVLDWLVEIGRERTEGNRVFGRMMGGGGGGCAIFMVKKQHRKEWEKRVAREYEAKTGIKPDFYEAVPSDGADILWQQAGASLGEASFEALVEARDGYQQANKAVEEAVKAVKAEGRNAKRRQETDSAIRLAELARDEALDRLASQLGKFGILKTSVPELLSAVEEVIEFGGRLLMVLDQPEEKPVVLLVNTPFTDSYRGVSGFLNSGRRNVLALKGPRGVFDEFYFDGHPKAVGVSRDILARAGIAVPESGILDPMEWTEEQKASLKAAILSLKDDPEFKRAMTETLGIDWDAVERFEQGKFKTLKAAEPLAEGGDARKVTIPGLERVPALGRPEVYANMHILDLVVRGKDGKTATVQTYKNSPVITDEVEILGVGPQTVLAWQVIFQNAAGVITFGDLGFFEGLPWYAQEGAPLVKIEEQDAALFSNPYLWKAVFEMAASLGGKTYQKLESEDLGVTVLMGAVSNTLKDVMRGDNGLKPDGKYMVVLPPQLFANGRIYGETEFLVYFNAFVRGSLFNPAIPKLQVVGTHEQLKALEEYLNHTIFGPRWSDARIYPWVPEGDRKFLKAMNDHYAIRSKSGVIPLEGYLDMIPFTGRENEATVPVSGPDGKARGFVRVKQILSQEKEVTGYDVSERTGDEEKKLGTLQVNYNLPEPRIYEAPEDAAAKIRQMKDGFSRTWIGTATGFDPQGDTTSLILWLEGTGIWVDPSHEALQYMEPLGITEEDVPYVLLTHVHQDHDGGVLRRILMGKRVNLIASRVVYEEFMRKAELLLKFTGRKLDPHTLVDWTPLEPGKHLSLKLPSGRKAVLKSWWNMHSIPSNGFSVEYDGFKYAHSGDTQWDAALVGKLQSERKITPNQAKAQQYRFWRKDGSPKYDFLDHEAGGAPIHTTLEALSALPETSRARMNVYHVPDAKVLPEMGLAKAKMFDTMSFVSSDEERKDRHALGVLAADALMKGKSDDFKDVFLRLARKESIQKGQTLNVQGHRISVSSFNGMRELSTEGNGVTAEDQSCMYFIVSGRAGIYVDGTKTWEIGPGTHFGDWAIVTGEPRKASVVAEEPMEVYSLTPAAYLALFGNPATIRKIEWLRENIELLEAWSRKAAMTEEFFRDLSDFALAVLAGEAEERHIPAGTPILAEGTEASEFFVVKSGTAEILKGDRALEGKTLERADYFGEISILRDIEHTATVRAKTDMDVLVFTKQQLLALLEHYPLIRVGMENRADTRILELIKNFVEKGHIKAAAGRGQIPSIAEFRLLLAHLARKYSGDKLNALLSLMDQQILDLAAGKHAVLVRELRGLGFSYVKGVDINVETVTPYLLQGDITNLAMIGDDTIDVAFITNFLQDDPMYGNYPEELYEGVAREVSRILRPGGVFYLVTGDDADPALAHFREAGLEVNTLVRGMYELVKQETASSALEAASLGIVKEITELLAAQHRVFEEADGLNTEVTARIHETGAAGALFHELYFGAAQSLGKETSEALLETHQAYLASVSEGLYRAAFDSENPEGEFAVLATTAEDISIPALERQLELNPQAYAVVVFTGPEGYENFERELKDRLKELFPRVELVRTASPEETVRFFNELTGNKYLQAMRARLGKVGLSQSDLARHITFLASEAIVGGLTTNLAVKLAAPREEDLRGISADEFRLYGNTVGFALARLGGDIERLSKVPGMNQVLAKTGRWDLFHFNLDSLSEKISQLVNEFKGFVAILRAA